MGSSKDQIKFKLATSFRVILKRKKKVRIKNKRNSIQDLKLVDSMRQLEADSGISYTLIQTLCVGKRDIQFTSLVTLLESLNLSLTEFAKLYDKISDEQMLEEKIEIEKNKRF